MGLISSFLYILIAFLVYSLWLFFSIYTLSIQKSGSKKNVNKGIIIFPPFAMPATAAPLNKSPRKKADWGWEGSISSSVLLASIYLPTWTCNSYKAVPSRSAGWRGLIPGLVNKCFLSQRTSPVLSLLHRTQHVLQWHDCIVAGLCVFL